MTTTQVRVDLPWSTPPISANARLHWRKRAALTANVREVSGLLIRNAHLDLTPPVRVELHYTPRDRRRRDPLNLYPTLKAIEDGAVDAGLIPDDVPEFLTPSVPVIDPPDPAASVRLYLLIEEDR